MTRVMIVEDQEMTRSLLEMIVNDQEDYTLVHSIANADLAPVFCVHSSIDLILMDVCTSMDASGLDAAAKIKEKFPDIRIIIITSMPEFSWLKRAREIGAESFWYKDGAAMSIQEVMRRTMEGESIYPDAAPELKLGLASSREFTDRELEILRELTTGDTNGEIGERLGISANTVRNTIQSMMDKTGFKSRTELAVEGRRTGLVIKDI